WIPGVRRPLAEARALRPVTCRLRIDRCRQRCHGQPGHSLAPKPARSMLGTAALPFEHAPTVGRRHWLPEPAPRTATRPARSDQAAEEARACARRATRARRRSRARNTAGVV